MAIIINWIRVNKNIFRVKYLNKKNNKEKFKKFSGFHQIKYLNISLF
jgi:hypothetical protein